MLITLNIHNRISNYIASFSAVLLESIYLFYWSVNVSRDCNGSVVARNGKKRKGGNPVLFDFEYLFLKAIY